MRVSVLLVSLSLLCGSAYAQSDVHDYWRTADGDAIVETYACEEALCGRFVWLKDDSAENPSLDDKNKDPDLRQRPLCGLTFIGGFHQSDDNHWEGGWIYSPRHGHSFSAELQMQDKNSLTLRGYVFLPFLGGSQTWQRVQKPDYCWKLMVR